MPSVVQSSLIAQQASNVKARAKNKLQDSGELVIKATASYTGEYDYTWPQVKGFFRDNLLNVDMSDDI